MKHVSVTFFLLLGSAVALAGQSISPKVSERFGQVIVAQIEFVEKPNTYYAQNIVKAKWFAKVKAVNGKALKEPVVMEYRLDDDNHDFVKGTTLTLKAFEDIESSGINREWDGVIRQFNYGIYQFLRVRVIQKGEDAE